MLAIMFAASDFCPGLGWSLSTKARGFSAVAFEEGDAPIAFNMPLRPWIGDVQLIAFALS